MNAQSFLKRFRACVAARQGKPPELRWVFVVGTTMVRTVTVRATHYSVALERAHTLCNDRATARKEGIPIRWDLFLIKADLPPAPGPRHARSVRESR